MTDIGSPSNESVQTRYSFYNAEESSPPHPNPDLNKEQQDSFLAVPTFSNSEEHEEDNEDSKKKTMSNNRSGGNHVVEDLFSGREESKAFASISNDDGISTTQYGGGSHSVNSKTSSNNNFHSVENANPNSAGTSGVASTNSSDDVEDILRSLQESENLGFHKQPHSKLQRGNHNENGSGGGSSISVVQEGKNDEMLQKFDNEFNPFTQIDLEKDENGNDKKQVQQQLQRDVKRSNIIPADSLYEKAVRDALYLIRLRSQKRAELFKAGGVLHSKQQQQPPPQNQNLTQYTIPESLESTSASGSSGTGLSLHPTAAANVATDSSNATTPGLVNATKLDDRLLSPPADVRKAVELSSVEMFRSIAHGNNTNTNTSMKQPYHGHNMEEGKMDMNNKSNNAIGVNNGMATTSSNNGLQLANPIYSTTASGGESPMHTTLVGGGKEMTSTGSTQSTSQPPFSIVPSSPAPHKLHLTNNNAKSKNKNPTLNTDGTTTDTQNTNTNIHNNSITQQRQMELELESRYRRDEEVEKGVEQVLLSILHSVSMSSSSIAATIPFNDKIGTTNTGISQDNTASLSNSHNVSYVVSGTSTSGEASKKSKDLDNNCDNSNLVGNPFGGIPRTSSKTCSVVDELLAETDDDNDDDDVDGILLAAEELLQSRQIPPQAPLDVVDESDVTGSGDADVSSKKNNASIRPYTVEADGTLEVEAVDRGSRQSSTTVSADDVEEQEGTDSMVLGPLNKVSGGTTGVVLHDTDDDDDDSDESEKSEEQTEEDDEEFERGKMEMEKVKKPSQTTDKSSQAKPKAPMKIIESLTAAVRNGSKASDLISKLGGEKKNGRSEEIVLPRRGSLPKIKELYAHMLPYQSNKSAVKKNPAFTSWFTEKLSGVFNTAPPIHPWDDDDPDELGYIVHTFSRLQLQLIEQDYDELMEKINKKFDVAVKRGLVRMPPKKKSERDLMESTKSRGRISPAKQRNKKNLSGKGGSQSSCAEISKKLEETRVGMGKRKLVNDQLATNPNFPNAKPAGSGDVGDLEIYHLPIIYKAQQTGFEPTKDLVLQPDTVFAGNYYVQSELGSAAFSTAYRCVDLNSGKKGDDGETYYDEVCLKVIKNTKDFFDQSLDEIKILELLRQTNQCHENNILEMKTFFYHKEHLIIVTELLRQNLFEFGKYITENEEPQYFTRSRLCYITRQCLVALSFVHKLGLVHSDIKPENILLASYSRARVKVIDFGSSCYLTDRQSSYIQSRSYRAPEVVLGLPYSGKIDIWSLGCVIAEMYTGQVTFQNDSVVTMLSRIEAICGAFPRHMIENGRQSGQFFTPSGLLYEKNDFDDDSEGRLNQTPSTFDDDSSNGDNELFNVYQPKITTMAARLGFEPNLMEKKRNNWEEEEKVLFVDFVTKLLTIDPDKRLTADEALGHPWILSGYNLSDEDLKYPPEE